MSFRCNFFKSEEFSPTSFITSIEMPLQSFFVKKGQNLQLNNFSFSWFKPNTVSEILLFKITDLNGEEVKRDISVYLTLNFR